MDFEDLGANLPFIVAVIFLIIFQFVMKRRRTPEASHQEIAQNLLSEIRLNIRLADVFSYEKKNKKFMTTTWELNKENLDFLNQILKTNITSAFTMAVDYNKQIDEAKRFKTTSYLISIDIDKLKLPLIMSQEGLEKWLQIEVGATEPEVEVPGPLDDFTGGR